MISEEISSAFHLPVWAEAQSRLPTFGSAPKNRACIVRASTDKRKRDSSGLMPPDRSRTVRYRGWIPATLLERSTLGADPAPAKGRAVWSSDRALGRKESPVRPRGDARLRRSTSRLVDNSCPALTTLGPG